MIRIISTFVAAGVIALSVPAFAAARPDQRGEAKLAKLLGDRVPGKPVGCITQRNIQSSQTLDGTAIVYESFGTLYVNRPDGAASLDDDDILVTRTFSDQLCRLDGVRLINRGAGFEHGFVTLNDFIPYTKPPKKD